MRKNKVGTEEVINVYLTEEKFPIAFNAKLKEVMDQKFFDSEKEARVWIEETPIALELYYSIDFGLFAVESEAVESADIYDPYTNQLMESSEDED